MTTTETPPVAGNEVTFASTKGGNDSASHVNGYPYGEWGFADAFGEPLALKTDAGDYSVKPLNTEDFVPWCSEIAIAIKDRRTRLIPANANVMERWRISANIEEWEFTPDDFMNNLFVWRPEWTKRIIMKSLTNAGMDAKEAEKLFKSRPHRANEMLAVKLSGLYSTKRFELMYWMDLGLPDPNKVQNRPQNQGPVTFGNAGGGEGQQPAPFVDSEGNIGS